MRLSSKKTTYIIDAMNFVWGMSSEFPAPDIENAENEFLAWLNETALSDFFAGSEFRIILDSYYRSFRAKPAGNVVLVFSDDAPADDRIIETAVFLREAGERTAVVTDDAELRSKLRFEGVKTMRNSAFFRMCEKGKWISENGV